MTVISSVKDLAGVKYGDQIFIEPSGFDGADHDPEAFGEASLKLNAEVGQALAKLEPPRPVAETIKVEFSETHLHLTSSIVQTVTLGGDVKDGDVKLSVDKRSQRKLTEDKGFVTINGERFTI